MTKKSPSPKFHEVAKAAKEPRGNYATAREMLDDLPAIIKQYFGADGVNVADKMLIYRRGQWRRSGRRWFNSMYGFACKVLQSEDLAPDVRAGWEVVAVIGRVVDAAEKGMVLESVGGRRFRLFSG